MLSATLARLERARSDDDYAALHFRRLLATLMEVLQAACLLHEASQMPSRPARAAEATLFIRRHLAASADPSDDEEWSGLISAIVELGA